MEDYTFCSYSLKPTKKSLIEANKEIGNIDNQCCMSSLRNEVLSNVNYYTMRIKNYYLSLSH